MYDFLKNTQINLTVNKFSISLTVFIISFLFFDILLLRIIPQPCQLTEPDQITKYRLIPDRSCNVSTNEFNVQYHINELGLRDYPVKKEKSEDEYRILFLGDSFTEGQGVQIEDTMVKKVEDLLNQQSFSTDESPPNRHFRTINAGAAGYSTLLEYLYLKNKGIELNPDLVIVNLNVTDFTEERANLKYTVRDETGEITGVFIERKKHLPGKLDNFLVSNSFIYNLLLTNEEKIIKTKDKIVTKIARKPQPEHTKNNTDFTPGDINRDLFVITRDVGEGQFRELFDPIAERILQIKDFLDRSRVKFILVIIPNGHQINQYQWQEGRTAWKLTNSEYPNKINTELANFSKRYNIFFVDPTDNLKDFSSKNPQIKLYYDFDGHLTKEGHRVVAQSVFKFLQEHEVLTKNQEQN